MPMIIFISYSSKSRAVVEALSIDLDALGYKVWFDRRLTGGHDWWSEILDSIRRSSLFLFALTPQALESHPCRLEFDYALQLNKRILPVMLAHINIKLLPSSLQKYQLLDYRQQNKQQSLALRRALMHLPPSKPMPKPLPPKPEMPLPPLTRLRDMVDATALSYNEQRIVVSKLKMFLLDDTTANDARLLLRKMRNREDLVDRTEREIRRLLGGRINSKHLTKKDTEAPTPRALTGHEEAVFSVAFSPSGKTVLTGSVDTTARLWDTANGEGIRRFTGHPGSLWAVASERNGLPLLTRIQAT